jgi:hypothetical protein
MIENSQAATERSAGAVQSKAPSILDGYDTRAQLAGELQCSERTIARYEQLPDGLPFVMVAGRKLYKRASTLAWLERREKKPNPRRAPGSRRRS